MLDLDKTGRCRRRERRRKVTAARFGHRGLFFDQSVLGKQTNASRHAATFTKTFEHAIVDAGFCDGINLAPFVDAFAMLELLGIRANVPILDQHKRTVNARLDAKAGVEEMKFQVFSYFHDVCRATPAFARSAIAKRIDDQLRYASLAGRALLGALKAHYPGDSDEPSRFICGAVALDRTYGFQYPAARQHDVATSFIVDVMRGIGEGRNYNQCRGLQAILADMAHPAHVLQLARGDADVAKQLAERFAGISNDIGFRQNQDFADTALVHFATAGIWSKGQLESALCMTCDDPVQTERRIAAYKGILDFIYQETLPRRKAVPFKVIRPRYGSVVFLSDKGHIVKTLHVKDVTDSLDFFKA